ERIRIRLSGGWGGVRGERPRRAAGQSGSCQGAGGGPAAAHRRQRLRPLRRPRDPGPQVRPAHLPLQLGGNLPLPFQIHRLAALSAPGPGQRRRPTGADPDQPRHRQQPLRPEPDRVPARRVLRLRGREEGPHPDQRGRRGQQGRARFVRQVFPRLHAEAVGPGPERTRRPGDGPDPDPDQPRRPLLHRHLPGDAAPRLHAHVRADAGPPEHQGDAQHRLPGDRGLRPLSGDDLHRSDRCLLRAPLRQAALPLPGVQVRDPQHAPSAAGRHDQPPERLRLHPRLGDEAPDRPGAPQNDPGLRVPASRGRPLLPRPAPGERRPLQALPGPRRADPERPLRRPPRHLPVLQHGPGGGPSPEGLRPAQRLPQDSGWRAGNRKRQGDRERARERPRERARERDWQRGRQRHAAGGGDGRL
ncbi:MAG: UDP-galactopyranose mutase, partial [uncultured Thermomicrobiales bacterium]